MLKRFLDHIEDTATALGIQFSVQTTADKKAGDNRWVWFEGLAEVGGKPYTGDLNSIPTTLLQDEARGILLGQPVVIVTFNEYETRAIRELFGGTNKIEQEGAHSFLRLGVVGHQEVIHVISQQGRKGAQQTATWAIAHFRPGAIIAAGIAFGHNNGKRHIGDVLVSDYIFDYESARINPDGTQIPRGARPPASRTLVDRVRSLAHLNEDWPRIHLGCIVCGDKLIDDQNFIAKLAQIEPEFVGGEMEAAGIEAAAQANKTDWIVIKGISDWGDGNKNTTSKDEDQGIAAHNAAQVVHALIAIGPIQPPPTIERSMVPAQPAPPSLLSTACLPPGIGRMRLPDLNAMKEHLLDQQAAGRPTKLHSANIQSETTTSADTGDRSAPVLQTLHEWLGNRNAPPLFALLGEYGMGKTINCQLFARQLDEARQGDPTLPIPLYFDLRHVTGLREKVPTLGEALEECMKRGWLDSGAGDTMANVHLWIAQGALVVFDGLDEVLVKLSEADGKTFTNNLLKLIADAAARAEREGRVSTLKILITCRTQYFPTLQAQNSHFTQSDRGEFSAERYEAMLLLPWTEVQVRNYLALALPEMNIDQLIAMVRAIHNLEELTQRPYTLKLIAQFIPDIERERATGRTVYGVTLYRKMAESWLARDNGKHSISSEHKLQLAAHLGAHLWRSGRNALPIGELNDWFHGWITTKPSLSSRYQRFLPDQLEEDLRTATFLARQDDGEQSSFRFAHTSLHEFFLACYLCDALKQNRQADWDMPVPSKETLDFLGQLIGEANNPDLIIALQHWGSSQQTQTSKLILAYAMQAQARTWPTPNIRALNLSEAKLKDWLIEGKPSQMLDLAGAIFRGAELQSTVFRHVRLDHCLFDEAALARSNFIDCSLRGAKFTNAELSASIFRRCALSDSQWRGASGYRPQWLLCDLPAGTQSDWQHRFTHLQIAPSGEERNDEQLKWMPATHRALSIAFAPSADALGRHWVATTSYNGLIELWDAESCESGPTLGRHGNMVSSCAFAPFVDSEGYLWLATAGYDGTIKLWDVTNGAAGSELYKHDGPATVCAFASIANADEKLLLATAGHDDAIRLWDVTNNEPSMLLRGHQGAVNSCCFAPATANHRWLASCGEDGTVRLWDTTNGTAGPVFHGHVGNVTDCSFAPALDSNGQLWLASAGEDGTLRLWDVTSGTAGPTIWEGNGKPVRACAFAPTKEWPLRLASTGLDNKIRIWNISTGAMKLSMPGYNNWAQKIAWAPATNANGQLWLAASGMNGRLTFWDANSGTLGPEVERQLGIDTCAISPVIDAAGHRWLCSTDRGGLIRLWEEERGVAGPMLAKHRPWGCCAFASTLDANGQWWVAGSGFDGTIELWDIQNGVPGPELRGHEDWIRACTFAPTMDSAGRLWLASSDEGGSVRLWDVSSGASGPILPKQTETVSACAIAPKTDATGRLWLATASSTGTVKLWDIENGKAGLVIEGNNYWVRNCSFAPAEDADGKWWLACTDISGTTKLWDIVTGAVGITLQGYGGGSSFCTFAPAADANGRLWLANACVDGTIQLWDAVTGAPGVVLRGHEGSVNACVFSPALRIGDQPWLLSAGDDGTLRRWNLDSGECLLVTALCDAYKNGDTDGYVVWQPASNKVIAMHGDAWRHLAWLQPQPHTLPKRLPLETFGAVPIGS